MRVAFLIPGVAGSFYCENCLRDASLVRALRGMGHNPVVLPLYLPPALDGPEGPAGPLFFGGINVFLQQKSAFFRHTPCWLDRLFDLGPLLRLAARFASMTDGRDLGETALSMLRGEEGRQAKELDRLVRWLAENQRPAAVCLSNALLVGVVRRLKEALGVPVVVALQDEDIFLDELPEPHRSQAYRAVCERASEADALVAVSHYYARFMRQRLGLPEEKLHVVHTGIPTDDYAPAPAPPPAPTLGFLERICEAKGADLVVDAYLRLRGEIPDLRLRLAGGWSPQDEAFVGRLRGRLAESGELLGNLVGRERMDFLRSLSVLCVPARHAEAFGTYLLEALATGVPVVLPRRGAFPELVEATGGGVLYDPEAPDALTGALRSLLTDPPRARRLAEAGREAVLAAFDTRHSAGKFMAIVEEVAGREGPNE